ncbi:hypothetical protein [Vibrio aestuarianus]|uniref:hypothetical protein n=1 Tax=Vibrio aestuarianus TaxID=28171 RepID=UPI00237C8D78|nr:hypothetical protein [Vibrio aestuarianus]MDE1264054.1 hypothetical protein [Vibrio aestuarianus]MDE1296177.1 hypothetical protein [Vibrio aestuarianus]
MSKSNQFSLLIISFLMLACSDNVKYVLVEDSLAPMSITTSDSRINTGAETKFSLKNNRNIILVSNELSSEYRTFEYGGVNHNKVVTVKYLVSEDDLSGPYLIVGISKDGEEIYKFGDVSNDEYIYVLIFLCAALLFYFFKRISRRRNGYF